jgi:uncharacterized protein with NRDE domain
VCTLLYLPLESRRAGPLRAALGLNRDEVYARPAAPPRWWPAEENGGVGFVAPVDLVAGGTWFGVAQTGLFVAITNGRTELQPFPFRHERSRGELVTSSLRSGQLDRAVEALERLDALAFAPCHLFLAQGDRAAHVAPDSCGRFAVQRLDAGPHALTNTGLDAGDAPALPTSGGGMDRSDVVSTLRSRLATHDGPQARCRHGEDRGTRSSAVLFLGDDLPSSRLLYAEGPPCLTAYQEVALHRHTVTATKE